MHKYPNPNYHLHKMLNSPSKCDEPHLLQILIR